MKTDNYNRYKLKISKSDYKCVEANGEEVNHFITPDTKAGIKKLYVVKNGREIYYVGITSQSISSRLRYGLKADGKNGYHGYKWKDKITQAELLIWSLPAGNGSCTLSITDLATRDLIVWSMSTCRSGRNRKNLYASKTGGTI